MMISFPIPVVVYKFIFLLFQILKIEIAPEAKWMTYHLIGSIIAHYILSTLSATEFC